MRKLLVLVGVGCLSTVLLAQQQTPTPSGYLLPPRPIVDVLDAPPPPTVDLAASGAAMAVLERSSLPALAELAQPMLRLAGVRINPKTNGLHRAVRYRALTIKSPGDGTERKVTLPPNPAIGWIGFSPDSTRFAFTHTRDTGIELWVGDTATGAAKALTPAQLNNALGSTQSPSACKWVGQGASLLCAFTSASRGQPPAPPAVPTGPNIQENRGVPSPVRTYQDLLTSAYDEALFEYYATSQLALVDAASGARTPLGRPAIFHTFSPSPDGNLVLVARTKRPFSWLVPYDDFPTAVEVWDRKGTVVKQLADLPVADTVPNGGVLPGPRAWRWQATAPATVTWAEALDGGDPKATVPHRDKVMALAAPFTGAPTELTKTEWRFTQLAWTEAGIAMLTENDRKTRMTRTWLIDAPGGQPRKLWERSQEDSYGNPGTPLRRAMGSGVDAVRQVGDAVYLTGSGSTPDGDRPFLDKLDLKTLQKERLFQSPDESYETVVGLISTDAARVVTRRESRTDAPNVFTRDLKANERVALTSYPDPAPPLKGAKAEMVTYQRKDGVQLRATIYTPPGWTPAQGAPACAAVGLPARVHRSAQRQPGDRLALPLHHARLGHARTCSSSLQGYARHRRRDDAHRGRGRDRQRHVRGAARRERPGGGRQGRRRWASSIPSAWCVGGHSYGAFMTANLLAHSDIFRAGIARSGAYNRTLTPFGFQNEQRTFWEVPDVYMRMSPFANAHKIKEPILLIHGEADDNSGTFPVQSERFYVALKGHGATVRYVTLPHEAHGYQARESVLHTVAEMLNWADQWARNAKPRATTSQQ